MNSADAIQLACPSCGTRNRLPPERLDDSPVCGKCGTELMEPRPVALDDETFEAFVAGTQLPVVVDFWADWCGPCRMMAPHFEAAAAGLPHVRFAKVDSDASPRASVRMGIRSIPTMILFRRGREIARRTGAGSAGDIRGWISQHVR